VIHPRRILGRLANRVRPAALVLLYHRVVTLDTDPQWLSVPPALFEQQVEMLKRNYKILPLPVLVACVRQNCLPRRSVTITFDDGYADNYLLAKPILAGTTSGAGKKSNKAADKADGKSKGKFRETMWFKKGELDVQAAEAAAAEHAKTGKDGSDKADQMPIDERYKDDGTLSRSDKEKYSLRTGATMMTAAVRDSGAHNSMGKVSEDALIDEMKGGRNKVFALIAIALVVIVVIIVMLAR